MRIIKSTITVLLIQIYTLPPLVNEKTSDICYQKEFISLHPQTLLSNTQYALFFLRISIVNKLQARLRNEITVDKFVKVQRYEYLLMLREEKKKKEILVY